MQFLSDEWIDALDAAASARPPTGRSTPATAFVVQQTVVGTDWGEVTYRLEITADGVAVRHGGVLDPTVSLTTDLETATAIARGETAAQLAFLEGRLRIGGHVGALLEHQQLLADLGDLFAAVRADTDW